MKKYTLIFSMFSLITIAFSSCKTSFNQASRETIQSEKLDNIEKIQFYADRKIILEHQVDSRSEDIRDGKLKTRKGSRFYRVKIPQGTKGLAQHVDPKTLKVQFENGEDTFFLFRETIDGYQLITEEISNHHYIQYKNRRFKVIKGYEASLMIKKKHYQKSKTKTQKVKGVSVS